MNSRNRFEKKELQNKLQGFQEGKDYSISSAENGKWIYDIHSTDLKKSLWGDRIPVWCKVEVYDNENEHYRGRFEGYENGYSSLQIWWRGEEFNPESHPHFENFRGETERFFEDVFNISNQCSSVEVAKVSQEIGNIFDDWKITSTRFRKGSIEKKSSPFEESRNWSATFDPPSDLPTCQCNLAIKKACLRDRNRCLKCGGIFGDTNRENIINACWDCGKFEVSEEMIENGRFRCNECDNKLAYLQEKSKENEQKNQQITNLKEENKTLNQQLEIARQAEKEAERILAESKVLQEQAWIELTQLREELAQVKQELVQVQEQLQKQKPSELHAKQLIEELEKSNQNLVASQKLAQKPKLNHQEITEVKNQLDNSRRILAAAAAHTQSVKESQFQAPSKTKITHEQSNKTNYFPYLVSGLVIFGFATLGLFFWQKKKRSKI